MSTSERTILDDFDEALSKEFQFESAENELRDSGATVKYRNTNISWKDLSRVNALGELYLGRLFAGTKLLTTQANESVLVLFLIFPTE